jgi:hypothetical protein
MAIVGFEFTNINVNKKETATGKINISNNVGIADIQRSDLQLGKTSQKGVKFLFEYKSSYEPDYAKIELGGTILYLTDAKDAEQIVNDWKKDKKLHKDVAEKIMNSILTKCNIQSIILSNTVNLPPPVPMPKVNTVPVKKEVKKEGKKEDKPDKQESLKK